MDNRTDTAQYMEKEHRILEKKDSAGNTWHKIYFGEGAHFKNWLEQAREVLGTENIEVEEVNATGLKCFEKAYRIWARRS
ncbi:MAG: hypothetical protein U9P80_07365 [Thermodesulfobacteriota bacterium]|nr:hypothetical protein [Thermodesulfobacteriota bacterium]